MGAIYLVRHGQASFGADDYDKLSVLGHEQARVAGAALRGRTPSIDRVVAGSMRRHAETARDCLDAMGCDRPIEVDAAWNEFDHEELILKHEPDFADRQVVYARIARASDPHAAFAELFRGAVSRWVSGAFDHEYQETWSAFRARCVDALDRLVASLGASKTAFVFTSGGPISAIVQRALALDDEHALALPISLANCGLTKLVYAERGARLSTLNEHAWFEGTGRKLLTFR